MNFSMWYIVLKKKFRHVSRDDLHLESRHHKLAGVYSLFSKVTLRRVLSACGEPEGGEHLALSGVCERGNTTRPARYFLCKKRDLCKNPVSIFSQDAVTVCSGLFHKWLNSWFLIVEFQFQSFFFLFI